MFFDKDVQGSFCHEDRMLLLFENVGMVTHTTKMANRIKHHHPLYSEFPLTVQCHSSYSIIFDLLPAVRSVPEQQEGMFT